MHDVLLCTHVLCFADHATEEEANSGCTATIALIRSDALIVANVGDSRAVLCRNGQALDLTTQHRVYGRDKVVQSEIERVEKVIAEMLFSARQMQLQRLQLDFCYCCFLLNQGL